MTKNKIKEVLLLILATSLIFTVALFMLINLALNLSYTARVQKNNNQYWQSDTPSYYKQIMKSSILHK